MTPALYTPWCFGLGGDRQLVRDARGEWHLVSPDLIGGGPVTVPLTPYLAAEHLRAARAAAHADIARRITRDGPEADVRELRERAAALSAVLDRLEVRA